MAVGELIIAAYNGPADLNSFDLVHHKIPATTAKKKIPKEQQKLNYYYKRVREFREGKNTTIPYHKVFKEIRNTFPNDWLLPVEIYELAKNDHNIDLTKEIRSHLETIKQNNPKVKQLINDGLALVK